jgi:thioredoxin 1
MRPVLSSDMHGGAPDSSDGPGDQYCFSGSRPDPLLDELSSGKNHEGKCCSLLKGKASSTFTRLVLEAEGPIVVEFMSYGCAHCRTIEPVLEHVAEMVKPQERFFRVNIAVEQELASNYQIQGTPTLVMFLHQNEVGRVEGPSPTVSSVLTAVTQPFES